MTPRPRRAEDLWGLLVLEAGEDLVERAAGVSVEDAARELASAGIDVDAERDGGERQLRRLERGRDPE